MTKLVGSTDKNAIFKADGSFSIELHLFENQGKELHI